MGALVLSRTKGETVVIADGLIEITVAEVRGDKVRLAFVAPKDIPIHRKEVQEAIAAGVTQATSGAAT